MVIYSLRKKYHLECFRCSVCGDSLGSEEKSDVRVRQGRLHCSLCYSDESGGC